MTNTHTFNKGSLMLKLYKKKH